tara:strand:- start:4847 stop:4993 length:147 start_codon:yes stop_codon:yes gene_type:complete
VGGVCLPPAIRVSPAPFGHAHNQFTLTGFSGFQSGDAAFALRFGDEKI